MQCTCNTISGRYSQSADAVPRGAGEGRAGIEAHEGFPTHDGVVGKPAASAKWVQPLILLKQEKLCRHSWVASGLADTWGSTDAAQPTLCVTVCSTAGSLDNLESRQALQPRPAAPVLPGRHCSQLHKAQLPHRGSWVVSGTMSTSGASGRNCHPQKETRRGCSEADP